MTYQAEAWRDFFLAVGGGAAALTGLVVVAVSMHLQIILTDPALRHRARMILASFAAVFVRCSLALMGGQDGRAIAVDLFAVCLGLTVLNWLSYAPVTRKRADHRSSLLRTWGATACQGAEMAGAALLFFGLDGGLNLAAVAMLVGILLPLNSSWLLLLGIRQDERPQA
jgi:hypothetical protein